ncbi:hypothetical protein GF325_02745 [Candidatus Bathyarchaeota archaeon]|nr:hypothetical protein [Candidatus Bathyarchaeota archaeon]
MENRTVSYSSFLSGIPHPDLESWMHDRVEIPKESLADKRNRYRKQRHRMLKIMEPLFAKIITKMNIVKYKWIWYKVVMSMLHVYMRIVHRLKIRGRRHIPENGAIMYLLHNGDYDVIYFLSAFKEPIGVFTDVGNGFFADFLETVYGFVVRRGTRDVMLEKMVRTILKKNRYFAIWPEGSPSKDGHPKEPFSGVIRVYATLNAMRDVIPFQPVLMRGTETYQYKGDRRKRKILVEFMKPFFLPRAWLKPPREGGKTPREMINQVMLHLAKKVGYTTLKKNHALERRRRMKGKPWRG